MRDAERHRRQEANLQGSAPQPENKQRRASDEGRVQRVAGAGCVRRVAVVSEADLSAHTVALQVPVTPALLRRRA